MLRSTDYEKSKIQVQVPEIGQVYYFHNGTFPFRVKLITGTHFEGEYIESGSSVKSTFSHRSFLLTAVKKPTKENTKENTMDDKKLYEIKGTKKNSYAHYLATNSEGLWVMEEKGTGKVFSIDKEKVTKVVPNCVGVRFLSGGSNDKVYHYFAPKDTYEVGELYTMMTPSGISIVSIAIKDCESEKVTKDFKPIFKILVEKVDKG